MGDALIPILTAFFIALVTVATRWIEKKVEKAKRGRDEKEKIEKSGLEFTSLLDAKVKNYENELMKTYRPCRMFVLHFFNGEVTFAGLHLLKWAIKHEIVQGPHIRYMNQHFQREPVPEMFNESLKNVFEHSYHVDNYTGLLENPPFQELMDSWHFKSMLFIGLKTIGTQVPSSILVMQWSGEFPLQRNDILEIRSSDSKRWIEKIYEAKSIRELHEVDQSKP